MAVTGSSCFWLVDFLISFYSETAFPNAPTFVRKHPWKFLYKDCSFCPDSLTNMTCFGLDQKNQLPVAAMLLTNRNKMSILYRGHSIDASYQMLVHFGKAISEETKLSTIHLWKVLYNDCSFRTDPLTNMVVTGNSSFCLVDF
jgi:hypothetical protein